MANDWCELTLEESMDAIIDYRGKTPQKTNSGIPLITAKIIKSGRIETVNEFISEDDYDTWMRRGIPNEGDVVMTTEAPLGEIAQLDGRKIALAQRVITLRGKKDVLDNTFLKYLMISEYVQHQLDGRGTGTTVKGIKQSELRKVMLKFPSFIEQKAIAHILGSLDDKIELNRQMNETLEAMAQALFKSWFVDFDPVIDNALAAGNAIPDEFAGRAEQRKAIEKKNNSDIQNLFPDEFEFTEEMGWIPKGWEISTLGQESDFSNGYAFKSKELTAESKDAFHVFKMGHIKRGGGFNYDGTKSYFPIEAAKDLERYLLKKGDLLMAMTDMKSSMALLGHTALMPEDDKFLVNQRVGRLSVKEDATLNYPYIYIYSNLDTTIGELRSRANSGVQVNLSTAEIKATNILVPSRSVHDIFNVKAISFFEKTFLNDRLNRKLAETRDTLLPKLMSGEIRISDAEALVENV